jgi:acyl-CoA thioester hydrolase
MEPFFQEFRARWSDMDFNQHMRNAAFLGCSEETRMRFMDANGWSMEEFTRRRLGPVVLEDRLIYKQEIRLLERFEVDLAIAAATEDVRRMRVRNRFLRSADGTLCATVESVVMWFDLDARKTVSPPPELRALWLVVPRTDDFVSWGA